ncbi:MAG: hypothetical protein IJM04_04095 [Prevotella sp.]|nr:hypothetical protein [Prevotella sp.]
MKEEARKREEAPMERWMGTYEVLKSKFRHSDQQIVIETRDFNPSHPQPGAELTIEVVEGTPELFNGSVTCRNWDAIDEEVRKLIEAGNVKDMYIDYV